MKTRPITPEELDDLTRMLVALSGLPEGRVAGFAVMVATFDEDGSPNGLLITSTPNLRTAKTMVDVAQYQIQGELDRLADLS